MLSFYSKNNGIITLPLLVGLPFESYLWAVSILKWIVREFIYSFKTLSLDVRFSNRKCLTAYFIKEQVISLGLKIFVCSVFTDSYSNVLKTVQMIFVLWFSLIYSDFLFSLTGCEPTNKEVDCLFVGSQPMNQFSDTAHLNTNHPLCLLSETHLCQVISYP